jgi:hypothetical protein
MNLLTINIIYRKVCSSDLGKKILRDYQISQVHLQLCKPELVPGIWEDLGKLL